MKYLLYTFLLVLSVSGCNEINNDFLKPKVSSGADEVIFEIHNNMNEFPIEQILFSEFIDSVRFIPLETTPENIMRNIRAVFFHGEEIITVDNERGEIYFYDRAGRYKRKISRRGRGPGEYQGITSCLFDDQREIFTIYDGWSYKLLEFDIAGICIREVPNFSESALIRDLYRLPDGHYLCYGYDSFTEKAGEKYSGLWETDSNGVFIKNHFQYTVALYPVYDFYFSNFFVLNDGTICIKDQLHSDVYKYKDDSIYRWLTFRNIDFKLSEQIGLNVPTKSQLKCETFQRKKNYIFFRWYGGKGERLSIIGIMPVGHPDKVRFTNIPGLMDNSLPGIITQLVDNNHPAVLTVSVQPRVLFLDNVESFISPSGMKALQQLVKGKTEEEILQMNPILELLYVKSDKQ